MNPFSKLKLADTWVKKKDFEKINGNGFYKLIHPYYINFNF